MDMVDVISSSAARTIAQDLYRHLSPVALRALAESLRQEEPSGKLGTATLFLLDRLEESVSEDKAYEEG